MPRETGGVLASSPNKLSNRMHLKDYSAPDLKRNQLELLLEHDIFRGEQDERGENQPEDPQNTLRIAATGPQLAAARPIWPQGEEP
jgi:hypothetical protein